MTPIERAAKIKEMLFLRGIAFVDIDRAYNLPNSTASRTAYREPNAKGEAAIADALACEPSELWPERYDAGGHRLEPQPRKNYERPPSMRQRRNERAA